MFPLRPLSPMALCSLYGPLSHLRPSAPSPVLSRSIRPTVLSMALYLLYSHLSPSKALCPLFSSLSPSTIFCTLYGPMSPMSPLWSFAPHMVLSSLYSALFPLQPSILSMGLCFLNRPLSSVLPSVSSSALIPSMATLCPL
jgi:hypothetical protein